MRLGGLARPDSSAQLPKRALLNSVAAQKKSACAEKDCYTCIWQSDQTIHWEYFYVLGRKMQAALLIAAVASTDT